MIGVLGFTFAQQDMVPSKKALAKDIMQVTKQIENAPSANLYVERAQLIFTLNAVYPYQETSEKDLSDVIVNMDKAIELEPDNPVLYAKRGEYQRDVNLDLDAAIADLTKAIELESYNPEWYIQRSNYKGIDQACTDWDKCAELGSGTCEDFIKEWCEPSANDIDTEESSGMVYKK